ncbi:hypothetical protein QUR79_00575 [Arcobacter cryaerophilus gv. pseudocryaerophilus]|uniref:Uncharacterized protein n=2 Tax=Arcobacteraceae TaxID=2808963 RepID=A0AAU0P420_9BACT|nr:hypothetical protein RJG54_08725 [Arcobacter sp. AZ-2023]WPD03406.1 hypothetical protein QUR79_00575 [Arcobacter sp. DSM 115972]
MKALKILLDERKQQLDIFEQNKELGNPNESNYIVLLNEAIKELEEYESDMDSYLDYTTGSRCTKSFNSCLGSIKIAYGKELEKIIKEDRQDRLAELEALLPKNKFFRLKTLEKINKEMIDLRKENQDLKSRSCVTCKYGHTYQFDEDIECIKLGADTQGSYFEKDFYCKNWELKNERD